MSRSDASKWKSTASFLKKARLPWIHYILSSIVPFISTFIYVYLPELEGRIAAGEVFDNDLIRKYAFFSILMIVLNVSTFYSAWVDVQFDMRIQKLTWRKLILMPMKSFERTAPSGLISRVTDDSTYVSSLVEYVISLVMSVYSAVLMIASLFRMNITLATYTVPVMLANFIFMIIVRRKGYDVGYSIQNAISEYTSFLSERASRISTVKVMGTEDEELARGSRLSDARRRAEMREACYEIVISAVMELTNILIVGFVLIGGSILVRNESMGIERLITFYILAMSLPNVLQELQFQLLKMEEYRGAVEVISSIADEDEEKSVGDEKADALESAIEFRNVSFSYESGKEEVLKDISFSIPKGKTTAIVGPTGSGKTSILKLLERFYEPDAGEILYDGRPGSCYDLASWRNRFGYIVQNSPLMSGSIRENILYGAGDDLGDSEMQRIAEMAGLDAFIDSRDEGFDAFIEGNGTNISGGQRQRIAIARAIASRPDILIMDEATSNLDPESAREINKAISEYAKDKTVIVVAHQMDTIKNADKIVVMDGGRIVNEGTHEELINKDAHYSRYCSLQSVKI